MKIITVSREFGSGGRELGKRLADELGFDYYDNEIITAIAQHQGMDESYVERALENHVWQTIPLTFGRTFIGAPAMTEQITTLLTEQRSVIEKIAKTGKDCIIVGRNADLYLNAYHPLNLFVCASMEAKIERCMERAEGEALTEKEIRRNIRRIDKRRASLRELISDKKWGDRSSYHLIINTTGWSMKELTPVIADFARRWFRHSESSSE